MRISSMAPSEDRITADPNRCQTSACGAGVHPVQQRGIGCPVADTRNHALFKRQPASEHHRPVEQPWPLDLLARPVRLDRAAFRDQPGMLRRIEPQLHAVETEHAVFGDRGHRVQTRSKVIATGQ
jgi:hypothetical protein